MVTHLHTEFQTGSRTKEMAVSGTKEIAVSRKLFWPILVIGIMLIVMPFAVSLPSRASAGQKLLNAFHPVMAPASVKESVSFWKNTFEPLGPVSAGSAAAGNEAPALLTGLSEGLHMTPAQLEAYLGKNYPAFAEMVTSLPKLAPVFSQVGPGIDHYRPLVKTMSDQVANYAAVDALPNFNLFTWIFVVPGALLVIFALFGLGLFQRRKVVSTP